LIREERGDTEFDPLKHKDYFEIPEKQLEHIFTEPGDLIFNNPLLKNYTPINDMTECNIDYNLQPRLIKECYVNNSSYQNDLYMKLNLSFTDNENVRTRLVDNEAMFLDSSLDFNFDKIKKMEKSDEKDLYIKKNEKVDEDNFIFELVKDDDKAIVENIEKEDNEIKSFIKSNEFWPEYIKLNLMPPFNYEKENISFKSFNTQYLCWFFEHKFSLELFNIFVRDNYQNLLTMIKEAYTLSENSDDYSLLKNYINTMPLIYGKESENRSTAYCSNAKPFDDDINEVNGAICL
jgi:hypothetical protein